MKRCIKRLSPVTAYRFAAAALALCVCDFATAQVVVLGNPKAGTYVIVHDQPRPKSTAAKLANRKTPGGGWKALLQSDLPGYGSMFCLRTGGMTQFFVTHGKPGSGEAVSSARGDAYAAAKGSGEIPFWCGAWKNENRYPLNLAAEKDATVPAAGGEPAGTADAVGTRG